jgi:hypothetical protein
MENKGQNNKEEQWLGQLMSGTKLQASDNLKYRIMQQIETEKSLSRQNGQGSFSPLRSMFSVFGVVYLVLIALVAGIYFILGKDALVSSTTCLAVLMITFVGGLFWMFSIFDDRRRYRKGKK